MSHLHSSALPRYTPIPKSATGRTRAQEKAEKLAAAERHWRDICRLVDRRDAGRCRVCGRACSPTALAMVDRAERHHLRFRSQGGEDSTANVLTICKRDCHAAVHTHGTLRLAGDADHTNERGAFDGVRVERLQGDVWRVVGWV